MTIIRDSVSVLKAGAAILARELSFAGFAFELTGHGRGSSYTRRVIPVTTHARPRALQYKATMTRTKACCNVALWVSARSAAARPSCTE